MILLLTLLISLTPCERFIEMMAEVHDLREAKLDIVTMKKYLKPAELDEGIMVLLHRIHGRSLKDKEAEELKTTPKEREDLTVFLMRMAREK